VAGEVFLRKQCGWGRTRVWRGRGVDAGLKFAGAGKKFAGTIPVSSEISDLCGISDLLLFFSYFASQNKKTKSGNYFFDVCYVN